MDFSATSPRPSLSDLLSWCSVPAALAVTPWNSPPESVACNHGFLIGCTSFFSAFYLAFFVQQSLCHDSILGTSAFASNAVTNML